MYVIGISGSPRVGGNSEILLDTVLKGAKSKGATVEKVVLSKLKYKPCLACGGCKRTGRCVQKDGLTVLYRKVDSCDRIAVASPIYFGGITSQFKAMIDRFEALWNRKQTRNYKRKLHRFKRRGVFVCVSAESKKIYFNDAKRTVRYYFNTIDMDYYNGIWCPGVDKKGDIKERKLLLKRAFCLGQALAS